MSPAQRSLKKLRSEGALVGVTERWNPHARRRHDLYGFLDLVAVEPGKPGCLGIQTTSGDHVAHRLAKLAGDEAVAANMRQWLAAGNRLVIHGWKKRGAAGARKLWTCREVLVESVP